MIEWCVVLSLAIISWLAFFYRVNYVSGVRSNGKQGAGVPLQKRKVGEVPPVYPNGWFGLLESTDLKKRQVKHVAALGENFAVFRTHEGSVNVIDAYCPHLGANMAEGGRVLDDGCLECPFHSWTFSGDGQCQNIPYSITDPAKMKTKSWICCEKNGYIFIWYHAEKADPEWQIESIPELSVKKWRCHARNQFYINCHIQEIPENASDWAHLNPVHGAGMVAHGIFPSLSRHLWPVAFWRPRSAPDQSPNEKSRIESTEQTTEVDYNLPNKKHCAMLDLHHDLLIGGKFSLLHLEVKAEQIGPGYVVLHISSALGPMCIVQTVTPIQPLLQSVTHLIFSPLIISPFTKMIFVAECVMFERDIAIWNHKKYIRKPVLVREDHRILAFRRWYSQFYSASSPSYANSIKLLDW